VTASVAVILSVAGLSRASGAEPGEAVPVASQQAQSATAAAAG
jgi:hypothetical protein